VNHALVDSDYNFLDRLLHRLALHYRPMAEMSVDLDQMTVRADPSQVVLQKHVFVSGLARAGTTVLMRRFHATGQYRSLTYRDMPFVLAPNLWRRLSRISRREVERSERAHGDNLLVDADSPESLDEVFWRIFAGDEYLASDRLKPHEPCGELLEKYVRYVNAILSANEPRIDRYLSKNNNNILRLGAIHRAFPNALLLIPFRDPLQHAHSLLRQHLRFSELQAKDEFVLSYMTWLGHHEFGLDHRPFRFEGAVPAPYPPDTLDYWLHLWCETYSWLERSKPKPAVFVCYEDLCMRAEIWNRLAQLAALSGPHEVGEPFHLSDRPLDADFDRGLGDRAFEVYGRLVAQAHAQLQDE
jgi:Sulfotransferase family